MIDTVVSPRRPLATAGRRRCALAVDIRARLEPLQRRMICARRPVPPHCLCLVCSRAVRSILPTVVSVVGSEAKVLRETDDTLLEKVRPEYELQETILEPHLVLLEFEKAVRWPELKTFRPCDCLHSVRGLPADGDVAAIENELDLHVSMVDSRALDLDQAHALAVHFGVVNVEAEIEAQLARGVPHPHHVAEFRAELALKV
mmetsp:Transcript_65585/g.182353  ORF Transcript_65585/g.182353 Transcript_65585/m.182353 type:complete len:202 (-) Transcript_65585:869-1474(-)